MDTFTNKQPVRVTVRGRDPFTGTVVGYQGETYLVRDADGNEQWFHVGALAAVRATDEDRAAALGLSEDLNDLRNKLGRVITRLDQLGVDTTDPILSNTLDAAGNSVPFDPQPTLASVAADAVVIAEAIRNYAALYCDPS